MANALFDPGREGFLAGEIDWDTATIRAALLRGYTFNVSHRFVSQVTAAGGVMPSSVVLTGKSIASGVADANDAVFPAVPVGPQVDMVLLYQSSAVGGGADVPSTSQRLIGLVDTAAGLPVTPSGLGVAVLWDNGPNKIFKL